MKIANLDNTALDTAAKFFRVMGNAGADFTGPMQDRIKRANLVKYLEIGCPEVEVPGKPVRPVEPASHEIARALLGDDFISPAELFSTARNHFRYTHAQKTELAHSVPSLLTLGWLREHNYMLIAGPAVTMTLRDIYKEYSHCFWKVEEGESWFMYEEHEFLSTDVLRPDMWLALSNGRGTYGFYPRPFTVEEENIRNQELNLNVAEVAYAQAMYFSLRGRTSSPGHNVLTTSRRSPRIPLQVMATSEGIHVYNV